MQHCSISFVKKLLAVFLGDAIDWKSIFGFWVFFAKFV
jgi:hypothetical protein